MKRLLYLWGDAKEPMPAWLSPVTQKPDVLVAKISDLTQMRKEIVLTFKVIVAVACASVRDQLNAFDGQLPPIFYLRKNGFGLEEFQPDRQVWKCRMSDASIAPIVKRLLNK